MAQATQAKASEAVPAAEVVVAEAQEVALLADEAAAPEESDAVAEAPAESEPKEPAAEEKKSEAKEKKNEIQEVASPADEAAGPEESNAVFDHVDPQKKALDELKELVQAALANNEFNPPPPPPPTPTAPAEEQQPIKEEPEAAPAEAPAPASVEERKPTSEELPKTSEAAPASVEGPLNPEVVEQPAAPVKKEPLPAPAQPAEEKAAEADDDGAKTVKAFEETVVPVAAPPPAAEEVPPAAEDSAKKPPAEDPAPAPAAPPEEVFIWGIPLVGDEKSDTILLKFLQARDFKVKDALAMLKDAVIWRKQFGIEALLEEDVGLPELDKVVYTHGVDKEGHPVCYNVYGEFHDKELYEKTFGDADKRRKFLKWRIQYLEKGIREQLDFTPGGISSMVQVTDLKNSPRIGKYRQVTKQAVTLLQDNYPEFIAKKVFINVPWWYLAVNRMMSPFFTQRTKSKFVFAGPSRSAETLFKYIAPEQVPVALGGLSKDDDRDFTAADAATDVSIKPSSKQTIEMPATEACVLVWELRVLGWEVSYGAEFTPSAEDGYTVIVHKTRKLAAVDEPVIKGSFKTGEPGKVVLTIDNPTSKKKLLLYRCKVKSCSESN
ncbi:CRAL/TRIO, N-terminal domain [Musa troglodytarum]|uniref:CRAL/TRIO, N-terminal domain n=1 Tax=Musa troglodytarum TaxID=320322 RepID=A0A9E7JI98_9LILI|nr:CRAL/TRIO, N-terminal domain [Musa troglodytarum]